ncbi:hypothetical protein A1O3_07012 [Capronia epimyces CBS 606.96]|uniref:Uncharacterized protein n=1 Tax=Capronia epimyces CBS 606.96 TaxID=1182542 RepID=W9XKH9_9EURO|nr:uncharacterized protein A1O3_07012 [Capronia epimyces CBS 606.96]EXJ80728.1 hypothetical protein A1O3_07012 [Capronia epimyces CBS 606.96]
MVPPDSQDEINEAAETLASLSLDTANSPEATRSDEKSAGPPAPPGPSSLRSKVVNSYVNGLIVSTTVQARRVRVKSQELLEMMSERAPDEDDEMELMVSEFLIKANLSRSQLKINQNRALLALDD